MSHRNGYFIGKEADRFHLTFSHKKGARSLSVRPALFYLVVGVLPVLALWYLFATFYLIFRDDMLASLMTRQTEMQYAYEDRITSLHTQIDQLSHRRLLDEAALKAQMEDVAARQARLERRATIVSDFAERMLPGKETADATTWTKGETSIRSGSKAAMTQNPLLSGAFTKSLPKDVSAFAAVNQPAPQQNLARQNLEATATAETPIESPARNTPRDDKPRPDGFDLRHSNDPETELKSAPDKSSDLRDFGGYDDTNGQRTLHRLTASLDRIEGAQNRLLANLQKPLVGEMVRVRDVLAEAGLSADRLAPADDLKAPASTKNAGSEAVGGPFVPVKLDADGSAFEHEAAVLQKAIAEAEHLRHLLSSIPLGKPLPGDPDITSGFGARTDPFLGRAAMHTGVDLREAYGTDIHATAGGKVTNAGPEGGYGNMVEVDHGNGLSTRYAHMASISVSEGQWVKAGQIVGHIGMTGRTTGPHLHYEVRIDGEPVDPLRFLKLGYRLSTQPSQFGLLASHLL